MDDTPALQIDICNVDSGPGLLWLQELFLDYQRDIGIDLTRIFHRRSPRCLFYHFDA